MTEIYLLTILETKKSKAKAQVSSISGGSPLPGLQTITFSVGPYMAEREAVLLSLPLLLKALILP